MPLLKKKSQIIDLTFHVRKLKTEEKNETQSK